MKITTSYNVRFYTDNRNAVRDTVRIYTDAVRYFLGVMLERWDSLGDPGTMRMVRSIEKLTHATEKNPSPEIPGFDSRFPKFPSYLRRDAISRARAMAKSYLSNLKNWEETDPSRRGRRPRVPSVQMEMPAFYKKNMFIRRDTYTASVKLFINGDWRYTDIRLRKCDCDYILHHCGTREECSPVLRRRGKCWELSFAFTEETELCAAGVRDRKILAVDLGINCPCTCSVMDSYGTVLGRRFMHAPAEEDRIRHKLNRVKKAQQYGARKTPRLWAAVNGANRRLSVLTAQFIIDTAVLYSVDTIVFEHLDTNGKKRGSKKQRLHMWRKCDVQRMVTEKAHRLGLHISRVCAWNTSRLAYDGSGRVKRGRESDRTGGSYSVCEFTNGKVYNCDLNASYNIGARYFIRELLKSMPATAGLRAVAEVPQLGRRSTCTWSSLISLNAVLAA